MGDRFATSIHIGGFIPDLQALAEALAEEFGGPEEDWEQQVRLAESRHTHIEIHEDEQLGGEFENLEGFLREKKISYFRHHGGLYEYDAGFVAFNDEQDIWGYSSSGDAAAVRVDLAEIMEKAAEMHDIAAFREWAKSLEPKKLPPITLSKPGKGDRK
jgi:hypothetical protein